MIDKNYIHILQQSLDACSDMVFVKDNEGVYLAHNQRFKNCLVRTGVIDANFEILGGTDYDMFAKEVADSYRQTDLKATEEKEEILTREAPSFGPTCPQIIIAHKRPLYNASGCIIGVIGTSHELFQLQTPENGAVLLSEREIACLSALFKGMSSKETGRYLSISHKTVETHIYNIKKKTGLNKKSELVDLIISNDAAQVMRNLF